MRNKSFLIVPHFFYFKIEILNISRLIKKGYVLENRKLFYRSQLRIAVYASSLFNLKARQRKNDN
jgi:hypothetical protein